MKQAEGWEMEDTCGSMKAERPTWAVRRKEAKRSPLAASDSVGMTLCRDGVDGPLSSMRL